MNIEELVLPNAGQSFKASDFNDLCRPGVYLLLDDKGVVLYVGMGRNIMRRLSGWHHKRWLFKECAEIRCYPCVSDKAAMELETRLIARIKPQFNTRKRYDVKALAQRIGYCEESVRKLARQTQ